MSSFSHNPEMEIPLRVDLPVLERGEFIEDRYRINEEIGRGGQGYVYSALDYDTGDQVGFKTPKTANEEQTPRVLREIELTEAFSRESDDVVKFVGAGVSMEREQPFAYMATELMEGGSLKDKMQARKWGALPVSQVSSALVPAYRAIGLVHDAELLHRDVKPANIFLDKNGNGKLGDFGIAGVQSVDSEALTYYKISPDVVSDTVSVPGFVLGSIGYTSPEALEGESKDKAADVFGAGATLHQALSGKHLKGILTDREELRALEYDEQKIIAHFLKNYEAPMLHELPEEVPAELGAVAISALERDPRNRPTIHEVVGALEAAA